jgi:hypothetical protein
MWKQMRLDPGLSCSSTKTETSGSQTGISGSQTGTSGLGRMPKYRD